MPPNHTSTGPLVRMRSRRPVNVRRSPHTRDESARERPSLRHEGSRGIAAGWIVYLAITAVVLVLLAMPLASRAQPARKVYRIGLLSPTSQAAGIEAFREGL